MKPKNSILALLSIGILLIACCLYRNHLNLLTTVDKHLFDIGNGLITFSLTIMLYLYIHHIEEWGDFHNIYSRKKWVIVFSTNALWLLLIPGTYLYYALRATRGDFLSDADTIMIPFSEQVICILLMLIPINLLLLSLKRSCHPTQFKPISLESETFLTHFWRIFYDILIVINCCFLAFFVFDGDHVSVVVFIGLLHNLFSLKFGKINSFTNHFSQTALK